MSIVGALTWELHALPALQLAACLLWPPCLLCCPSPCHLRALHTYSSPDAACDILFRGCKQKSRLRADVNADHKIAKSANRFSPAELLSCLGAGDSAFALRFTCRERHGSHCNLKAAPLPAFELTLIQEKCKQGSGISS